MPTFWFDFPVLLDEPFIAINLANTKAISRKKNKGHLDENKAGDWTMPQVALDAGLNGKVAILFYCHGRQATLYRGRIQSHRACGKTANGRTVIASLSIAGSPLATAANCPFHDFSLGCQRMPTQRLYG